MARLHLTPRGAFILFVTLTVIAIAQMTWWIVLMARLVDEKVDIAHDLGADPAFLQMLHDQEISRQVMIGLEGIFFLILFSGGAYVIYRSLAKTEELKFRQQNFLMAVTHELKTPLASMKLYLNTLNSSKIPDEKKASVVPRMNEDLSRLEKLVDNILEAGRFERHGYELHRTPMELDRLVKQLLGKFREMPTSKPLAIEADLSTGVIVNADSAALSRAIEAVLENGLKYNDKEDIRLSVELTRSDWTARLVIADNGIGLEKSDTRAIFERFYRVGSELSRAHPGSGLGLYLCREIVRAHGGDIIAESDGIGHGTRFIITLETEQIDENNTAG